MSRHRAVHRLVVPLAVLCGVALATASFAAPRVIQIKGTDDMKYSVTKIEAKPGEELEVQVSTVSSMSKAEMAHNFVLLAKGAPVDALVMEAAMARGSDYIPPGKKKFILASSGLAGGGETVKVTFKAPTEPGEYMFICTFPGHFQAGMKGTLIVK